MLSHVIIERQIERKLRIGREVSIHPLDIADGAVDVVRNGFTALTH